MHGESHVLSTQKAFDILQTITGDIVKGSQQVFFEYAKVVGESSKNTDDLTDVEFVDVEVVNDIPRTSELGRNFTGFNHFIDIKKGPGSFDDYDGYSYAKGSAHIEQYQDLNDAVSDFWEELVAFSMTILNGKNMKVDELIAYGLNDEYVHVLGEEGYQNCSLAMENYSYPADKGIYATVIDELRARFPLADFIGASGKGFPYSVFMPVDNLARYWYQHFIDAGRLRDFRDLGHVMHAIQDASIPHHAAGYCGNWHGEYEDGLKGLIEKLLKDDTYINEIRNCVAQWNRIDPNPPTHLNKNDWQRIPAKNWQIDMLVTWVALIAYEEYATTYNHFKYFNKFDEGAINRESAKKLTKYAIAACTLVLINLSESFVVIKYNGNGNTSGKVPKDIGLYLQGSSGVVLGGEGLLNKNSAFESWNTEPNGQGLKYHRGDSLYIGKRDVTLYAIYTPLSNTKTVTFDPNGGLPVPKQFVPIGGKAYRPSCVRAPGPKIDYELLGWFLGNEKFSFDTPITEDITLRARWQGKYRG